MKFDIADVLLGIALLWGMYTLSKLDSNYHEREMYKLEHTTCEVVNGKAVMVVPK